MDDIDNIESAPSFTIESGVTSILFKRKLDTLDAAHDVRFVPGEAVYFIAAVGAAAAFDVEHVAGAAAATVGPIDVYVKKRQLKKSVFFVC